MPRGERPLDTGDGALVRFATRLRGLREQAGSPPYRELARLAHYSAGTLSDAAGGRRLPGLSVTLAYVRACGGDVVEWEQYWHRVTTELAADDDADNVETLLAQQCPYVGLAAFQPDDADRFHGRDAITAELVRRIRDRRFLAVFGASGSGKSSVLRAGVVARLRSDGPVTPFRVVVFTPGARPIEECALALADVTGMPPAQLRAELQCDPDALHLRIRQATADSGRDVVLIVDQFEEVFTLCQDRAERERFITALLTAVTADGARTRVVLGVRTDFFTHCAAYQPLVDALQDAQVLIGAMTNDELRAAITQPAIDADCTVESALVATIMAEAAGQTGVLPLVSHALWETWRRRRGNALTLSGYQAAGGITHAIAHTAEAVYRDLDVARQRIARDVFLRMSALGEDTQDTKRRIRRRELDLSDPNVGVVLERLVRARLITVDGENVDLAHEALIRYWPRLREWQATDRDGLLTHRRLTEATEAWEGLHRDEGALYRGSRLAMAREWAGGADVALTPRERAFLDASVVAQDRDRRAAGRRTWQLRWLVLTLAVLLIAGTSVVVSAQGQHEAADQERIAAVSRQLAAESVQSAQPDAAMLLAVDAFDQSPTTEARSALLSAQSRYAVARLIGQHGLVTAAALSPDGAVLATAGDDDTITLWNTHGHTVIGTIPRTASDVHALAFSPDGTQLVAGGNTGTRNPHGTVTVWDVATMSLITPPTSLPADDVTALQFSPDGRTLAVGTDAQTTMLLVAGSWQARSTLPALTQNVVSLTYDPAGELLAIGNDDGSVQVWNVVTGTQVVRLPGPYGRVWRVVFGGGQLAVANADGTVALWNTSTWHLTGTVPADPPGGSGVPLAVAISPDGHTLATVGQNGVQLWDIATRLPIATLATEANDVSTTAQFSPDGRTLLTTDGEDTLLWDLTGPTLSTWPVSTPFAIAYSRGGLLAAGDQNGRVQLWQPTARQVEATLPGTGNPVTSLSFSPNGELLAVSYGTGPAKLWNVYTDTVLATLRRPGVSDDAQTSVAFSPDGRTLAAADADGTVALWHVGTSIRLGTTFPADGNTVVSVAFSPDGRSLATVDGGGANNPILMRDIASGAVLGTFGGDTEQISDIAFSPDGSTLVTAGSNGPATLWSTRTFDAVATLAASTSDDVENSAVFSPDGRIVATTGADGAIELWDATGHNLIATLSGEGSSVLSVAFSPDGGTLASIGNEHGTYLWNLDPSRVIDRICRSIGPVTPSRWVHLTPNLPYQPVCG